MYIIKSPFIIKAFYFNKLFELKNKATLWMEFIKSHQPSDNVAHFVSSGIVS